MKELSIGNSVTSIEKNAFSYCGLKNVIFPNSITSIGNKAFYGCGLSVVSFNSDGVIKLGESAFYDNSITEIYCNATQPPVSEDFEVFSNSVYTDAILYVPEESVASYYNATPWSKFYNINFFNFSGNLEIDTNDGTAENTIYTVGSKIQMYLKAPEYDYTYLSATWSSSDSSVATVDENGVVTIVGEGSATITATFEDGRKASVVINASEKNDENWVDEIIVYAEPDVVVYNLNGVCVYKGPKNEMTLRKGIYIIIENNKSKKVVIP